MAAGAGSGLCKKSVGRDAEARAHKDGGASPCFGAVAELAGGVRSPGPKAAVRLEGKRVDIVRRHDRPVIIYAHSGRGG